MEPCPYHKKIPLCDGIEIQFIDVGHLLGSSSIELWISEEGETIKLVFSGDVGNLNQPLIKDPEYISQADYVVVESTYGNRLHQPPPDYAISLADVIQRTLDRGGNVIIPSFAVGRTQEILYFIREIRARGLIKGHNNFPVYVDSPLAIEATNIFQETSEKHLTKKQWNWSTMVSTPITFYGLHLAVTSDESKAINFDNTHQKSLFPLLVCAKRGG